MNVKLDQVITLAIGRNYGKNNTPLSDTEWHDFRVSAHNEIAKLATIVFEGNGGGVGSDEQRNGEEEDSYAIIFVNCQNVRQLRRTLAKLLKQYKQSSACYGKDNSHRPIWNTKSGRRAQA